MITLIHINGPASSTTTTTTTTSTTSSPTIESEDEGFSENSSLTGVTIKGPSGSVRGIKHCVRQSIQSYYDIITNLATKSRNYQKEEKNKCVLYSTTLGIVRSTFENCRTMRNILFQNLILYEERDVYINGDFRDELIERLGQLRIPSLFVEGKYLGGVELVEKLNESGKLMEILHSFRIPDSASSSYFKVCPCCGNARFIPCNTCNGSKKSLIHHFTSDSITLRCSQCNATGLVKCPKCDPRGTT